MTTGIDSSSCRYEPRTTGWFTSLPRSEEIQAHNWRDPGFSQTQRDPVVCVSWQDATAYSDWLARKTHRKVRLPSEAEFEYAARASSSGSRYWGSDELGACRYANVLDQTALKFIPGTQNWAALVHPCSDGFAFTSPVGSFRPNRWGLYDMLGNVWEWTQDCYHDSYLGAPAQGTAWTSGDCNFRVDRGGT